MNDSPLAFAHPRHPIPGEDPEIARLTEMVVALLGEVTVLTERLDTVERLLDAAGLVAREAIESFEPQPQAQAERDSKRRRLVAAILRPLRVAAALKVEQAGVKS